MSQTSVCPSLERDAGPAVPALALEAPLHERVAPCPTIRRAARDPRPNDRCPCGSGKKSKRCCAATGEAGLPARPPETPGTPTPSCGFADCCAERLRLSASGPPLCLSFGGYASPS